MKTNLLRKLQICLFVVASLLTSIVFAQTSTVTFNVNMKQQSAIGNFNPKTEFVDLAGSFNNWGSAMLADVDGDSIYTTSVTLNVGVTIEFKARINGLWTGREEFSGGGPNRTYIVEQNGVVSFWYNDELPSTVLAVKVQASSRAVIPNQSVQFFDKSNGSPVSWEWSFSGGSPVSSQVQSPVVSYASEGKYSVTLKIKNAAGDSIWQTLTDFINVAKVSTYWWNDAVFYEVFVRSFYDQNGDGKGDLKGLTAKLDYLNDGDSTTHTDLGINAIWLMPIMQSPSYHGYDVTDYRTIESDYGTNADFTAFIQAAHQRGIKVIVDLVMNHNSTQNPWFIQSASSPTSTYRNWYRWNTTNPGGQWYLKNNAYYYGVFGSGMPDLNYANAEAKAEMFDIARYWLQDMQVDGFRLDAVKYIFENGTQIENTPETLQFWKEFRTYYKSVSPNAFAVGEAWTSTNIAKKYVENDRLDYCFEFSLAGAIVNAVNSGNVSGLQTSIEDVMASYPYLQFGTFLTNHDQGRVMSVFGSDVSKAKLAAQLLLSLPGIPYIYYGEEIGTIGPKPDENIRTPLQWSNAVNAGFSTVTPWRAPQTDYSTKNIASQQENATSLWATYNKMIQLRNSELALRRGNFISLSNNATSALTFMRQYQNESIIVATNMSNTALSNLEISLTAGSLAAGKYLLKDLLTGSIRTIEISSNGGASNQNIGNLAARSSSIYKVLEYNSGLNEQNTNQFRIFPIPAKDNLTIQLDEKFEKNASVSISDMSGKTLRNFEINGFTTIPVSDLKAGFYMLNAIQGKQIHSSKMIIVK
jgi:alpha-amylase